MSERNAFNIIKSATLKIGSIICGCNPARHKTEYLHCLRSARSDLRFPGLVRIKN